MVVQIHLRADSDLIQACNEMKMIAELGLAEFVRHKQYIERSQPESEAEVRLLVTLPLEFGIGV